jgi:hypothetical protein
MFDSERFEPQADHHPGAASLPLGVQGGEDAQGVVAQLGRSGSVALGVDDTPRGDDARENLLRLWRSAAHVVHSDPVIARRTAYEAAIAEVLAQLPSIPSFEALMDSYETITRAAITAMASRLHRDGRVMNEIVIAGAACWSVLSSLVETHASHPE